MKRAAVLVCSYGLTISHGLTVPVVKVFKLAPGQMTAKDCYDHVLCKRKRKRKKKVKVKYVQFKGKSTENNF